jgi:integration host factor subunit alpha
MNISARRVLTFKPSQILKEDITDRYSHRLDENGNEDTSKQAKDVKPRALSSFLNNTDDTVYDDSDDSDDD